MKRILRNFAIYSAPDLIARLLPFITLPITTGYLTLQDFGNIALFSLCIVPFSCLTEYGSAYIIFSSWFNYDKRQQGELLFILTMFGVVLNVVAILMISLFYEPIFSFLLGEGWNNIKDLYWLVALNVLCQIPSNLFNSWVIIEQRALLSSSIRTLAIVLGATVLLSITVLTQNYRYIIMGNVAVGCVISLIEIAILIRTLRPGFNKEYLSLILRVGSPIFIRSIFNQTRKQIDRFFIANLWGGDQFALYNLSSRVYGNFSTFSGSFESSYEPDLFRQLAAKNVNLAELRRILFLWFYAIFFVCSLIFVLGKPIIALLTHGVFSDAYPLILLFTCCVLVTMPFIGQGAILVFHQKTKYQLWCTLVSSVASLLGCISLIPRYGAIGGVAALWFGILVKLLLYLKKKQELFPFQLIEKMVWPYVFAYHVLVILKTIFGIEVHFVIGLNILAILTIHGLIREKDYVLYLYNSRIKNRIYRVYSSIIRSL
jgi:O-antigen/teichoic acid export membrane protein